MKKIFILVFLIISAAASAQLSTVNIGAAANDGTGDPLRTAFGKINVAIDSVNNLLGGVEGVALADSSATAKTNSYASGKMLADAIAGISVQTDEELLLDGLGYTGVLGQSMAKPNSNRALSDGNAYYVAVYVPTACTTTGAKVLMNVAGIYTADNYNGMALYSVSGGTYTLIDSAEVTNGNMWKATANTIATGVWHSTHVLTPGVYMLGLLLNSNGSPATAPRLMSQLLHNIAYSTFLTNNNKIFGYVAAQTAFPASETGGDVQGDADCFWAILY
jgi:hypothetical protein